MGVTGIHRCYFIVSTLKDIFGNLMSNYGIKLKEVKLIIYCGNCNTVLLEESKREEEEEGELNSIQM